TLHNRCVPYIITYIMTTLIRPPAAAKAACEKDSQCGGGMCCAVSLWIRSLRICTPMGQEGDDCHPMSHKVRFSPMTQRRPKMYHLLSVPFFGKRIHHTCPCLPNLSCISIDEGRYKCLSPYGYPVYYL
uniref:Prokineticin 2 n=1 Tax=Echeneis naucrates TaxID=173247 RepID=A0A665UG52_ECHNA